MLYNRHLYLRGATFDTSDSRLVANESEMAENRYRAAKKSEIEIIYSGSETSFDDETKKIFSRLVYF